MVRLRVIFAGVLIFIFIFKGCFHKKIPSPLASVRHEMLIANSTLRASSVAHGYLPSQLRSLGSVLFIRGEHNMRKTKIMF